MDPSTIEVGTVKPAVVTVGDELMLGEHHNENQIWLLKLFWEYGCPAHISMALPDAVQTIAFWIRQLAAAGCYPIFVSGGIGGTHDDCTREAIARALEVPLAKHDECYRMLAVKYGERFTSGRQRMAFLPTGCQLIANPIGAPGFAIKGIYAFPGFPSMLHPMAREMIDRLLPDNKLTGQLTREVTLPINEGEIAWEIESFAQRYPELRIGIYPDAEKFRRQVTVRIRCVPTHKAGIEAFDALIAGIKEKHGMGD